MDIKRRYIIGEEWLYIKVYAGPKLAEEILLNEIRIVVEHLLKQNFIDKFFFIRYFDESYHLRLRFRLKKLSDTGIVINELSYNLKRYVDHRLVTKVVADTYVREIERYGATSIEEVETLFSFNSWQTMVALSKLGTTNDAHWLWGIKSMDLLLDTFHLTLREKYDLYESYFKMHEREFGDSKQIKEFLKKKNRQYIKDIESAIAEPQGATQECSYDPISDVALKEAVGKLRSMKEDNTLMVPFTDLLRSIMHMHYNRIFRTNHRMHEFVIYYMCSNFYKSSMIRQEKALSQQQKIFNEMAQV